MKPGDRVKWKYSDTQGIIDHIAKWPEDNKWKDYIYYVRWDKGTEDWYKAEDLIKIGELEMNNLTVETQVVKTYKFLNLPVIGDGVEKLAEVEGWLLCNWEGEVVQYVKNCPTISSFSPSDKGGLSVFGLNKYGKVIVGMCQYPGDKRAKDPLEHGAHLYCKATNCTRCWQ